MYINRKIKIAFVVFLTLFLTSCGGIFTPKGIIAMQQKDLILLAFFLMLIVVIPVLILSIVIPIRYRESKKREYLAEYKDNVKLEIFWWAIPIIIISILSVITWKTSISLDPYRKIEQNTEKRVEVQVVSLNWKWLFIYPQYNIATVNLLVIPENTPIDLQLTSDGPMNSFWIPQLAGQIYTMTGMPTELSINALEVGEYDGVSSNYSGDGFADMRFTVKAKSMKDFEEWIVKSQNTEEQILSYKNYHDNLRLDSINNLPKIYTDVEEGLFKRIMHQYMNMKM